MSDLTEDDKQALAEAICTLYEVFQKLELKNEIKATVELEGVSYDVSFKPTPLKPTT